MAQPHGLVPVVRETLGEFRFGDWEGKTFDQLHSLPEWQRFNTHRSIVRPPGGEMMLEVQARMVRAAEDVRGAHSDQTVVIVSHADPLRALLAHYLGSPLDLLLRFNLSPASLTAVRFSEDVPTVLFMNDTATGALEI